MDEIKEGEKGRYRTSVGRNVLKRSKKMDKRKIGLERERERYNYAIIG